MGFGLLQGLGQGWLKSADIFGQVPEQERMRARDVREQGEFERAGELHKSNLETQGVLRAGSQAQTARTLGQTEDESRARGRLAIKNSAEDVVREHWGKAIDPTSAGELERMHPGSMLKNPDGTFKIRPEWAMEPDELQQHEANASKLRTALEEERRNAEFGDQDRKDAHNLSVSAANQNMAASALSGLQQKVANNNIRKQQADWEATEAPLAKARTHSMLAQRFASFREQADRAMDALTGTVRTNYSQSSGTMQQSVPELNKESAKEQTANLMLIAPDLANDYADLVIQLYKNQNLTMPVNMNRDTLSMMMLRELKDLLANRGTSLKPEGAGGLEGMMERRRALEKQRVEEETRKSVQNGTAANRIPPVPAVTAQPTMKRTGS